MDYRTRANLRDLLARLYYRDPDIERVVLTVDLNPADVAWDLRPVNTWRSILEVAENQGKLATRFRLKVTQVCTFICLLNGKDFISF